MSKSSEKLLGAKLVNWEFIGSPVGRHMPEKNESRTWQTEMGPAIQERKANSQSFAEFCPAEASGHLRPYLRLGFICDLLPSQLVAGA